VAEPAADTQPEGLSPELKAKLRKPRPEIAVGGCREQCRAATQAFGNFLDAIPDDPRGAAIIPFLDTSELSVDGQALGAGWVEQWKARQREPRKASILAWAAAWLEWYRGMPDPQAFLAEKPTSVRVIRDESEEAVFAWRHPHLAGDVTAAEWIFVLRPRGLEWLIVAIDCKTGEAPARR
jgi:hypothetical protein